MTAEEWTLAATCFLSGLASGLLGMLSEALPADWESVRQRYFTINWIQLAVTWAAFALFLSALISL